MIAITKFEVYNSRFNTIKQNKRFAFDTPGQLQTREAFKKLKKNH